MVVDRFSPAAGTQRRPRILTDGGSEPLLRLPPDLRDELKDPLGPIETDTATLLERVDGPLVTVGDVVTYHVLEAGRQPDLAVVDERTERSAVDSEIGDAVASDPDREVMNPAATITEDALEALQAGLQRDEPTTILVDGEEDLVVLPAILLLPDGASVVYGQPGEGMVHVRVTAEIREEVRELLGRFDGEVKRCLALLEDGR